jgi:hypothetical protein
VQEAVDLFVVLDRARQVLGGSALGANEVVAVHRRGHRHALAARLHELQQRHLGRGVLQRDTIDVESKDRTTALPFLAVEVVAVRYQDFFREGQAAAERLAGTGKTVGHGGVEGADLRGHRSLLRAKVRLPSCAEGRRRK